MTVDDDDDAALAEPEATPLDDWNPLPTTGDRRTEGRALESRDFRTMVPLRVISDMAAGNQRSERSRDDACATSVSSASENRFNFHLILSSTKF